MIDGKYKALTSFVGKFSMRKGEIKTIPYHLAVDFLQAGYVEEIEPPQVKKPQQKKKTTKKKTTKKKTAPKED